MNLTVHRLLFILALFVISGPYLPLLFNNLPPVVRSHHVWTVLWVFSLILFYPRVFVSKLMIPVIIYGIFLIVGLNSFWSEMNWWNVRGMYMELYEIFIGSSVIAYFSVSKDYKNFAKVILVTIIFMSTTAIMTIYSASIDPMYARNIAGSASIKLESEIDYIYSFKKYGGGDYSSAIALIALIPILIFILKNTYKIKIKRWLLITSLVLTFVALFSMQIFTNVLIAIIVAIFAFFGARNIRKSILISLLVFIVIATIPRYVYIKGLYNASEWFEPNSEMNYKFTDMAIFLETGTSIEDAETGTGQRAERYPILWKTFIEQPLMGCFFFSDETENNYDLQGGHLHWMNKLTVTGIIGIFVFFLIPYTYLRQIYKKMSNHYKYFFILATTSILIYGFLKVIAGRHAWYMFFIIIPGINYLPLLFEKKHKGQVISTHEPASDTENTPEGSSLKEV